MQLLLLADGTVGFAILDWLAKNWPRDLALVLTTSENELSEYSHRCSISTKVFESQESLAAYVRAKGLNLDLGLMAWWPTIIDQTILSIPASGFINTHPSLLPHNRGKHYNFWALVESAPFGVTLHRVDDGIDTGAIVAQQAIPYSWEDTGATLYAKAQATMVDLFKTVYPSLRQLNFESQPQPPDQGSFHRASELDRASQIHLDQQYTARDLLNLLRARTFRPHPGCWFVDQDGTYEARIEIVKISPDSTAAQKDAQND